MSIRLFSQLNKDDIALAGGKGASLAEMTQAGIPVPPGFVVTTQAFEQYLSENELHESIQAELSLLNYQELENLERASEAIRGMIFMADISYDLADQIRAAYDQIGGGFVAVRSSATAEDGAQASWAGELDSFLYISRDDLLANIRKCWASLFTPRALFYRFEKGLAETEISLAVVVQKMVNSEVSGVAFSVHPVTEDRNQMVIEAGFGLGEAVVSGAITPDNYVFDKRDWSLLDSLASEQSGKLIRGEFGKTEWVEIPVEERHRPKLNPDKLLELARLVERIEQHYGFPCDVEWALENGQLYILQSRPITTLDKPE